MVYILVHTLGTTSITFRFQIYVYALSSYSENQVISETTFVGHSLGSVVHPCKDAPGRPGGQSGNPSWLHLRIIGKAYENPQLQAAVRASEAKTQASILFKSSPGDSHVATG